MMKWPPTREKEKVTHGLHHLVFKLYEERNSTKTVHDVSATVPLPPKKKEFCSPRINPISRQIGIIFHQPIFFSVPKRNSFFSATEIEVSFLVWPVAIQLDQIPEIPHDRLNASWSLSKYSQICRCGIHGDTSPVPFAKHATLRVVNL